MTPLNMNYNIHHQNNSIDSDPNSVKSYPSEINQVHNQEFFKNVDLKLTELEKNRKLKCIYDICKLYQTPNANVIDSWKDKKSGNKRSELLDQTIHSLSELLNVFNAINIKMG